MSHEPFSVEEVCDVRVQNSNVHCNSDSIERVTQQFDGKKEIERVSKSGRVDKTKSPRLHLFKKSCMCGTTPDMRGVLHTEANNTPIQSKQLGRRKKTTKAPQNTQPLRSLFRERSNVIFPRKITRKRNTENIENR